MISAEHASVITRAIRKIPAPLQGEYAVDLEVSLVESARQFQPLQVARLAQRALAVLDPDGAEPDDREHQRQRGATLTDNPDGSGELHVHLTPVATAAAHAGLDPLAQPRPSADGQSDPRTPAQRLHDAFDAFDDAMLRLLRDGGLPDTGGTPATLVSPWILSGKTNLDELLPLCGHHHRQYDRGTIGWHRTMINHIPRWTAPH